MKPEIVKTDLTLPSDIVDYLDSTAKLNRSGLVAEDGSFVAAEPDERSSNVYFFRDDGWVGQFCIKEAMRVNADIWQYDLFGIDNHMLQYTTYQTGDHYTWHIDTLDREIDRKLSFSLVLNDDYEGGEFQFARYQFSKTDVGCEYLTVPQVAGSLIVFPSSLPHRVLPVKSGIRKSIVGWFVGRPLR